MGCGVTRLEAVHLGQRLRRPAGLLYLLPLTAGATTSLAEDASGLLPGAVAWILFAAASDRFSGRGTGWRYTVPMPTLPLAEGRRRTLEALVFGGHVVLALSIGFVAVQGFFESIAGRSLAQVEPLRFGGLVVTAVAVHRALDRWPFEQGRPNGAGLGWSVLVVAAWFGPLALLAGVALVVGLSTTPWFDGSWARRARSGHVTMARVARRSPAWQLVVDTPAWAGPIVAYLLCVLVGIIVVRRWVLLPSFFVWMLGSAVSGTLAAPLVSSTVRRLPIRRTTWRTIVAGYAASGLAIAWGVAFVGLGWRAVGEGPPFVLWPWPVDAVARATLAAGGGLLAVALVQERRMIGYHWILRSDPGGVLRVGGLLALESALVTGLALLAWGGFGPFVEVAQEVGDIRRWHPDAFAHLVRGHVGRLDLAWWAGGLLVIASLPLWLL
ncbi:MAG: hypothetical protein AAF602_03355, partial [Myxococcota bacterium]